MKFRISLKSQQRKKISKNLKEKEEEHLRLKHFFSARSIETDDLIRSRKITNKISAYLDCRRSW